MPKLDRSAVRVELLKVLTNLREDWDFSDEITEKTGLFSDMQFESIDAVALGSAIEEHFNQSLPFAEFLAKAYERQANDITIGELLDFIQLHLRPVQETSN
ncbi:MAG: phosphopantetheine-binding protein [Phycisphaerales bacterium]|nr:phosphopantetheine-binding protein [Phycisphaerales bacterium]